jgi:hypothetical protein
MESKDRARRRVLAEKPRNRRASGKLGAIRVADSATVTGASRVVAISILITDGLEPLPSPRPPRAVSPWHILAVCPFVGSGHAAEPSAGVPTNGAAAGHSRAAEYVPVRTAPPATASVADPQAHGCCGPLMHHRTVYMSSRRLRTVAG